MLKIIKPSEVWFAYFPFEEEPSIGKARPVIVLYADAGQAIALAAKVTSHVSRISDPFDVQITQYIFAGLIRPSVVRVAKTMKLSFDAFDFRIGILHPEDYKAISEAFERWQQTLS